MYKRLIKLLAVPKPSSVPHGRAISHLHAALLTVSLEDHRPASAEGRRRQMAHKSLFCRKRAQLVRQSSEAVRINAQEVEFDRASQSVGEARLVTQFASKF
jgi:hypothetical protein